MSLLSRLFLSWLTVTHGVHVERRLFCTLGFRNGLHSWANQLSKQQNKTKLSHERNDDVFPGFYFLFFNIIFLYKELLLWINSWKFPWKIYRCNVKYSLKCTLNPPKKKYTTLPGKKTILYFFDFIIFINCFYSSHKKNKRKIRFKNCSRLIRQ